MDTIVVVKEFKDCNFASGIAWPALIESVISVGTLLRSARTLWTALKCFVAREIGVQESRRVTRRAINVFR